MRQREEDFKEAGAQVVLVGMGSPRQAEAFRERFQIRFPIICDTDRQLYRAYHLKRMGFFSLFSPSLALKGLSAMSQGHLMGIPEGDIHQLSGVFVIDASGRIRFRYHSKDPSDLPPMADLLSAVGASAEAADST